MPISLELIGRVAAALAVAFLIALILTPVVRNLAVRMGAVDDPKRDKDAERRMHTRPIPRMGGLAIFLGFLLAALVFLPMTLSSWVSLTISTICPPSSSSSCRSSPPLSSP